MHEEIDGGGGGIDLQGGPFRHQQKQFADELRGGRVNLKERGKDLLVTAKVEELLLNVLRVDEQFAGEAEQGDHRVRLRLQQASDGFETLSLEEFDLQRGAIVVITQQIGEQSEDRGQRRVPIDRVKEIEQIRVQIASALIDGGLVKRANRLHELINIARVDEHRRRPRFAKYHRSRRKRSLFLRTGFKQQQRKEKKRKEKEWNLLRFNASCSCQSVGSAAAAVVVAVDFHCVSSTSESFPPGRRADRPCS